MASKFFQRLPGLAPVLGLILVKLAQGIVLSEVEISCGRNMFVFVCEPRGSEGLLVTERACENQLPFLHSFSLPLQNAPSLLALGQSSPSLGTWPWERRTVLLLSAETDAAPLLSILFSPPSPSPGVLMPFCVVGGSTLAGRVVEGDEDAFMRAVREAVQEEDRKGVVAGQDEGRGEGEEQDGLRGEGDEQEEGRGDGEEQETRWGVERETRCPAFVQEQSAEEARASVGGSSGDGRDAGGMEACQGQSHRGDHGSRERGAQSARAGESGGKEGLPSCDGLPVLSSAAAHHLSLHSLAAVRRQWDAFLLPLPCSAPTPHPQVPRRPLGALVPSTSHTPHTRQLLAATSFMREGLLPFSARAAPAAGSDPVAAASLPSGAHAAGAHVPSAHAPGTSVPPCWVPAPQPATSEWRRYLRRNG